MIQAFLWIGIFIASLAVLIKASDYFTISAEKIGKFFRIPPFIIGVTIVSIGTSLPELVSSIIAVLEGSSEIVAGNVIGSNIANIFLVLGVAAIVSRKLKITYEISMVDLPLLMGSTFLMALAILDGEFSFFEGILSLMALIVYIMYTINAEKSHEDKDIKKEMKGELRKEKLGLKVPLVLVLSSFFIYLGAKYTISAVIEISGFFSIGTDIIAASAVALGTSLPELMVTISAARKGKPEIAVGNVLGSNIFNALGVMGVPALIGTLAISAETIALSLPVVIAATLLFFFVTTEKNVTRWEGWMLIIFYAFYIGKLFSWF